MKNKLTDFQADWAAMPVIEKDELKKLKNKTILISGHSIARCLCYALIYQNETRNLGCKVVLCAQDKSLIDDLYPELILREDFDFVDFNSVSEINKADLCMSFEKAVTEVLIENIEAAIEQTGIKKVVLAGGVSANTHIRSEFEKLEQKVPDLYIVSAGKNESLKAIQIAQELRKNDLAVETDIMERSFGAQMKYADKINAKNFNKDLSDLSEKSKAVFDSQSLWSSVTPVFQPSELFK